MRLIGFLVCILFVQTGCDRPPQLVSSKTEEKKPIETTEWVELSLESVLESVAGKDKESVGEAHKAGRKDTVGMADGKWWIQSTRYDRVIYLRAIGDLVSALSQLYGVTIERIMNEKTAKGLDFHFGNNSLSAAQGAESKLSGRIEGVMGGRSFGDLADAVTKFYQNKPLLKDKPVLWVLAVPLYKELEDSKPQDKRNAFNDIVKVPMKKTSSVN